VFIPITMQNQIIFVCKISEFLALKWVSRLKETKMFCGGGKENRSGLKTVCK
jgi:hypothetical protein